MNQFMLLAEATATEEAAAGGYPPFMLILQIGEFSSFNLFYAYSSTEEAAETDAGYAFYPRNW